MGGGGTWVEGYDGGGGYGYVKGEVGGLRGELITNAVFGHFLVNYHILASSNELHIGRPLDERVRSTFAENCKK